MNDELILQVKEWKLQHPGKASRPRWLKEALQQIKINGFETPNEILWSIMNNNSDRPTCVICGSKVNFISVGAGFSRTCSQKCACKDQQRNEKIKQTCQKRFGVSHQSKLPEIQLKIKQTNLERYGYKVPSVIEKIKKTNIERYGVSCTLNTFENKIRRKETWLKTLGVDNPAKSVSVQKKMFESFLKQLKAKKDQRLEELEKLHEIVPQFDCWTGAIKYLWLHKACGTVFDYHFIGDVIPRCPTCFPRSVSYQEKIIQDLLKEYNVDFETSNRKLIKPYEIDILIPSHHLAIEVNGCYWHHDRGTALPLIEKTALVEQQGHQLLHFWDFEIRDRSAAVKNIILAKLNLHEKVYARMTIVNEITAIEAAKFLNEYHLSGFAKASCHLSLSHGNEIVAVASFSKNRFNDDGTWEIVRFGSKLAVIGGLSKLINAFQKIIPCVDIVSFADRRVSSNNNGYLKIGFELTGITKPNYFYFKGDKRLARQQAMKHKLGSFLSNFDIELSEHQNMMLNGWLRCFDCGSYKLTKRCNQC